MEDGSWRELASRFTIEFRAYAARPSTRIKREFTVPVSAEAWSAGDPAREKMRGEVAAPPILPPLRITVRGVGQVALSHVVLTNARVASCSHLSPTNGAASLASTMNRTQWHRIILLSTGFLTIMPVTCNSILAKRNPKADDGYEYVMVSGSRIPQRVKKGEGVTSTNAPVEVMNGESLRNYTQKHQNVTK